MEHIKFHIEEGIATITMNRPDRLNAFNRTMAIELQHCLDVCATDHEVRVVLLTGAGKGFTAGQDLGELTGPNPPSMAQILSEHYNPIIRKIRTLAKPVYCTVLRYCSSQKISLFHTGILQDRADTRQRGYILPATTDRLAESIGTDDDRR
jgi:enoyl-CoA hydratase/carnithine racemase